MTTETLDINPVLSATEEAISELTELMKGVQENKVNTIPYKGSWTAPQLLRHVTKSLHGMAGALGMEAKQAPRDPSVRVEQLKIIMQDSSNKLTPPDFIVPEEMIYEKNASIQALNSSFIDFKKIAESAKLNDLIEGFPLGPITKFEIIHFVLYHTQRHLQQMKRICEALEEL
ncbi:MAG TPA: DinB family protein [Cytophagaceae bacterium]|jgi:hypothetical protein